MTTQIWNPAINARAQRAPIHALVVDYRNRLTDVGLSADEADLISRRRSAIVDKDDPATKIIAQKGSDGGAEVLIYDRIGFDFWTGGGFTPQGLSDQLAALKPFDSLVVRINSPGGDVFDGMTIFNILRRQEAKISVEIEGIAASAASYIAQAADKGELRISEAAQMMIHQAQSGFFAMGDADDLEAAKIEYEGLIDVMRKIDGQIAGIYSARSGRKPETWRKLMQEDRYFTGQEAVEEKLADATITTKRPARNQATTNELPAAASHTPGGVAAWLKRLEIEAA